MLSELCEKPWAILPERLRGLVQTAVQHVRGELDRSADQSRERLVAARGAPRSFMSTGSVCVLPLLDVISHRDSLFSILFGGTSTRSFTRALHEALDDPGITSIVFDVDSPGGSVDGVEELSAEIYRVRGKKRMVAVANTMMASAAYWIGTAADELVVTPSGSVGSVGVYAAHEDISKALEKAGIKISLISSGKYKTEGFPFEPLSDDARAAIQHEVNVFADMFVNAVARNRGISASVVRERFGQGRMVLAADAVKRGMADRLGTLDQVVTQLTRRSGGAKPLPAALAAKYRELELY